ncbi:DegT/DnrJ/EryC1/StrS family aminotransferase [Candidatus Bipolaricaulota bacterium]|nr:DegT/DnrJ/EryC1/StrS family aminotransferase [Candidatus Bipolaricaulota bacterium]
MNIPLARPDIAKEEIEAVVAVLRTPHLALGPKLKEFEDAIAEYSGVRYVVAVNSGTSALHLIIRALGIGAGDEVITTPFSFISSSNCILFERAKPVFVDIEPKTLNIDPERIEEAITPKTKAILAVDVFGHPADWPALEQLAERHNVLLVEDSAEALGSKLDGKRCGSFGRAGIFGFYPNKQITTGEGGIIVTDDAELAALCRSMANQGRGDGDAWLSHVRLGYNYRMDEMSAALGLAQLSRIEEIVAARAQVAVWYAEALERVDGVKAPFVAPDVTMSWFVYVVRLDEGFTREDRDRILKGLRDAGIECRNYFPPIHLQPFYREALGTKEGDFPITESVAARTIALPFYNKLTKDEVSYVVDNLADILKCYHLGDVANLKSLLHPPRAQRSQRTRNPQRSRQI